MPPSPESTAGVVRSMLGERKLEEALALATRENAAHPNNAVLLDLVGEVRYRRGEVEEAAVAFRQSAAIDPCLARTHYDIGRFANLSGLYASAQAQLDMAHKLAPDDPMIKRAWEPTQRAPQTPEQVIALLRQRLENGKLTDEQKAGIESSIKAIQAQEKGNCELVEPVTNAKITMWAANSSNNATRPPTNSGVDISFNGKRRRFIVDTGASGILISKDAAKSLGLTPEAEAKAFGFGDKGMQTTYVAHVDNLKIGTMEFRNCLVRVLETNTLQWTDGLLGPDVFRNFVVTLDFPAGEMRLSPLPKRPDEATASTSLQSTGEAEDQASAGETIAQRRRDRYIAPEMKDWQRIYRTGHELIVPTTIGNAPKKLFILDTGAGQNLISIAAAREVTHVSSDGGKVSGISGEVKKVEGTNGLFIQFANVRQQIPEGLNAIDLSSNSRYSGVEISGFIGYPILHQLVMQIDYRDNLVKVTYVPHVSR